MTVLWAIVVTCLATIIMYEGIYFISYFTSLVFLFMPTFIHMFFSHANKISHVCETQGSLWNQFHMFFT